MNTYTEIHFLRDDEENKEATESGDVRGRTQSRGGKRWMRIRGRETRVTEKKREGVREGRNRGEDGGQRERKGWREKARRGGGG